MQVHHSAALQRPSLTAKCRTRWACALAAAAMIWAPTTLGAFAANAGTQQMTLNTTGGSLTVTAPGDVDTSVFPGTTMPGQTITDIPLGTLTWQNTLNNGVVSSMSIAMTDFYNANTAASIPFSNMAVKVGQSISGRIENTGTPPVPAPSGPYTFAGADPNPGSSFANVVSLVAGSTTTAGTWNQGGNALTIHVPANIGPGSYVATIQYTLTA